MPLPSFSSQLGRPGRRMLTGRPKVFSDQNGVQENRCQGQLLAAYQCYLIFVDHFVEMTKRPVRNMRVLV